MKVVFRL